MPDPAPSGNLLSRETSPYLLQHKDNPVHWRPWGPEALAEAKATGKPILLSVGYAACHWCHVMAHECFEDPAIAALMNRHLVNIKVDREERPDVDSIYQTALALMGEQGGWPLTMFLTADGEPFWGGTYFPPTPRFGRPAFPALLEKVAEVYAREPAKVAESAAAIRAALQMLSNPASAGAIDPDAPKTTAFRLLRAVDPVHGGIGRAPKFPQPALLELMWRGFKTTKNALLRQAVTLTCDRMCQGGIYDHLGGGFARYSTDAEWLVPHFEKMLYDNAQLVDLLLLLWQETRSPLYAARIGETLGWALREMRLEGGAFASSLDADSEGREGRFYVWSEAEVDRLLGPEAAVFKAVYDVTAHGNWEGVNILRRRDAFGADPALEARLAHCRAVLLAAREQRVRPARDDKVLADWNGLLIASLAAAGAAFERPDWIAAADRANAFVAEHLRDGERLSHSWCAGRARHPATLDDHATLARAALALFEATGEARHLERARGLVALADRHYWDATGGGYFLAAADTSDLIARTKTALDGALPSGNAIMVQVLARLHYLTGAAAYRERAEAVLATFASELAANAFSMPGLLIGQEWLARAAQIVILGDRGADDTRDLLRAVYGLSLPNRVLQVVAPDSALPAGHPAAGRGCVGGRATAYVCRNGVCSLPITESAALTAALEEAA